MKVTVSRTLHVEVDEEEFGVWRDALEKFSDSVNELVQRRQMAADMESALTRAMQSV